MYPANHIPGKLKGCAIYATLLLSLISFSGLGSVQEGRSADSTKIELHERAETVTKRTVRYQAITPVSPQLTFDSTHRSLHFSRIVIILFKQSGQLNTFTDLRSRMQAFLLQSHRSTDPDLLRV